MDDDLLNVCFNLERLVQIYWINGLVNDKKLNTEIELQKTKKRELPSTSINFYGQTEREKTRGKCELGIGTRRGVPTKMISFPNEFTRIKMISDSCKVASTNLNA